MIRTNLLLAGDDGYNLTKSLRFRSSASAYLNRTPASATNRTTWTWSGWVKLGALNPSSGWNAIFGAYSDDNNRTFFYTNNNSVSNAFYFFNVTGGSTTCNLISTQLLRDPSAWYHLVVSVDTTQGTSTNRVKIYLNGSQITSFGTATYPSSSANFMVNNNVAHYIGASSFSGINLFHDGYMTEVNLVDGQALTPSSFGSTNALTGVWQPAKYTGTYGTNGFYLPFTDTTSTSTLGNDFSGNSNTWTVNNISLTTGTTYDSMNDVPTLTSATVANYATINPLDYNSTYLTLNDGNLHQTYAGVSAAAASRATITLPTTGKFYWEVYISATGGGSGERIRAGITRQSTAISGNSIDGSATSYLQMSNGQKRNNSTDSTYGAGYTAGQYIQVLYDATAGAIYFGQNNSFANGSGSFNQPFSTATAAFTGLSGEFMPCFITYGGADIYVNFGQQPFAYTPPTGFVALNTFNLPTSTIVKGNTVMDATLYTGNGTTQSIVNTAGFKPDFVWSKNRSNARNSALADSVRGATLQLISNTTSAEFTGGFSSFNSNGFSVNNNFNENNTGETYVGWQWQAGQGSSSSNTAGSITSTVSVNASAGFSVVTYTGTGANATVGHGLGVAPSMYIVKSRSNGGTYYDWAVYHTGLGGNTKTLWLNLTNSVGTYPSYWNSTSPTSSVFSLGNDITVNQSSATYVAYCWAEIAGFSKFGSYTGNGSSDGPFVYTGFRPKFVLVKKSSGTSYWQVLDSTRSPYNLAGEDLFPDLSDAEATISSGTNQVDMLSNGFKIRNTNCNDSGGTYIYMAFAENPFKNALAR